MIVVGSIVLNMLLVFALAIVVARAKRTVAEEKLATFVGCLGAITDSIAMPDLGDRVTHATRSLAAMNKSLDANGLRWRLMRAGLMRVLRHEPTLADIGGEHARTVALRAFAERGPEKAEAVWQYLDAQMSHPNGREPREEIGEAALAEAQYKLESDMMSLYRVAVAAKPPSLFS